MNEIVIPAHGVAMTEALLVSWLKQPGDEVSAGEAVAQIETDKATMDLPAPATGRLGDHLAREGEMVPVGQVLAHVLEDGEVEPSREPPPDAASASREDPPPDVSAAGDGSVRADPPPAGEHERPRHRLSPRARRVARESANAAPLGDITAGVRAGGRHRAVIAARVTESWQTIPHFAVTREVRAHALLEALAETRERIPELTLTDLLLRCLAMALQQTGHPAPVDVGLAVASSHGVMVPVVPDAAGSDLERLVAERRSAVERGRAGRLRATDLQPPASTLSNLGAHGVDHFTGIIAVGQTSVVTVGRAVDRVIAGDDGPLVTPTFFATLNADHRSLDGADAALLLAAFAELAEAAVAVIGLEENSA